MGLGGVRKRTKLSQDPNNTSWSRSLDGYGQRLLQSKGWTPGESLGARNKTYTRAKDPSYIRVSLKDDNLGLGAKSGVNVPVTGLDAFQGLLGRLNGKKDAELEKEQKSRDDLRRAVYTENRWGALRFVSGGFLVGDRVKELVSNEAITEPQKDTCAGKPESVLIPQSQPESIGPSLNTASKITNVKGKAKKSRKRSRNTVNGLVDEKSTIQQPSVCDHALDGQGEKAGKAAKSEIEGRPAIEEEELERRAEKAQRRLARRARREEKQFRRLKRAVERTSPGIEIVEGKITEEDIIPVRPTKSTAPSVEGKNGRYNVRSRYVQQKKLASMDPKALNEIFMIKT